LHVKDRFSSNNGAPDKPNYKPADHRATHNDGTGNDRGHHNNGG
jgi:hypothetical protein